MRRCAAIARLGLSPPVSTAHMGPDKDKVWDIPDAFIQVDVYTLIEDRNLYISVATKINWI